MATILLLSLAALLLKGVPGWIGYLVGAGTSFLNLCAWWWICGLAGRIAIQTDRPQSGTSLVFLAFLMKLPILVALYFSAKGFGGEAVSCFMAGLILVYFALAGWALGKSQGTPRDSNG